MRYRLLLLPCLLAIAASAGPALAQGAGDAAAGQRLAAGLCAPCHRMSGEARDAARVPPDFGAIAAMPSLTETSLRVFLSTPHGEMPRYRFSPEEMDDIVAYLLGLRQR